MIWGERRGGPRGAPEEVTRNRRFLIPSLSVKDLLRKYENFCWVDMKYSPRTIKKNMRLIRNFLEWLHLHGHVKVNEIQKEHVRLFLRQVNSNHMYAQYLKSLRSFYRDFLGMPWVVEGFRYPPQAVKIRSLPSKKELQAFYYALPTIKDKALFLMYATSGLRRSEVLSLTKSNIDWSMRMIIPNHISRTKRSYVSFFNDECEKDLREYLKSRRDNSNRLFRYSTAETDKLWAKARERTGLNITPQILRIWFCQTMGELGVPDRYIDAMCGRIPKSVLARHYSDFSPKRLKQIYDKAGLKILS